MEKKLARPGTMTHKAVKKESQDVTTQTSNDSE